MKLEKGTKVKFKSKSSILSYYEKYIKLSNVDKYVFEIGEEISSEPNKKTTYTLINSQVNKLLNRDYIFGDDCDFEVRG